MERDEQRGRGPWDREAEARRAVSKAVEEEDDDVDGH